MSPTWSRGLAQLSSLKAGVLNPQLHHMAGLQASRTPSVHVHTCTALWHKAECVVGAQEIVSLEKEDASLSLPHTLGGMTWGITGGPVGCKGCPLIKAT